jgi:hypothetical protein
MIALIVLMLASPAHAFHHHGQFQEPADGRVEVPGSGGLYYTGSRRDLGLRCSSCHVEAPGRVRADVTFSPALTAGRYAPAQRYEVTVTMRGESMGIAACTAPLVNRNAMSAMFTGRDGFPIGRLSPDRGSPACGSMSPSFSAPQTTVVFGDCDGVVGGQDSRALTTWRFFWDAPPAGAGEVGFWLGVVDGNCVFDSYDDDVYETSMPMGEGSMAFRFDLEIERESSRGVVVLDRVIALPPRKRGGWVA